MVKLADLAVGAVQVVAEVLIAGTTEQPPAVGAAPAPAAPAPAPAAPALRGPVPSIAELKKEFEKLDPFTALSRTIEEQKAQIATLEGQLAEMTQMQNRLAEDLVRTQRALNQATVELAQVRREHGQAVGELVRVHVEGGAVPRTVAELRAWREARDWTQREAAEVLGVGRATIDRAEAQAPETPLGRALTRALVEHEGQTARQLAAQRQREAEAERQRQAEAQRQRDAEVARQRQAEAEARRQAKGQQERPGKLAQGTRGRRSR